MPQFWRRVKIDKNDVLFSQIIRFGKKRCERCGCVRDLQCAHVMSRKFYSTRFMFKPVKNGISLCANCHSWFDEHKISALIFEPAKRVLSAQDESFTFLVKKLDYNWGDLQKLYWLSRQSFIGYQYKKKEIAERLSKELRKLKKMSEASILNVER